MKAFPRFALKLEYDTSYLDYVNCYGVETAAIPQLCKSGVLSSMHATMLASAELAIQAGAFTLKGLLEDAAAGKTSLYIGVGS